VERITCGHVAADTEGLLAAYVGVSKTEREGLRRELGLSGTVFLYVGRLIPLKGLPELLSAWSGLDSLVRGRANLLLVGDGPERAPLEALCRENGLTNVRFVVAVDYDRIAPYYAAADLFVMPTLEDNWSLVVPEAMACGLPILCSKYNGCWPELVREGENGWVFDPLDRPRTCGSLKTTIAASPERLRAMGRDSSAVVRQHLPGEVAQAIHKARGCWPWSANRCQHPTDFSFTQRGPSTPGPFHPPDASLTGTARVSKRPARANRSLTVAARPAWGHRSLPAAVRAKGSEMPSPAKPGTE
jgi:hypothetical protein